MSGALELSSAKRVLVELEIDAFAAKGDALHFQAQALFRRRLEAEFNLTAGTYHALPRELTARSGLQEPGNGTMVQGITGSSGDLPVSGDFPFRDRHDYAKESGVTNMVRFRAIFENVPIEMAAPCNRTIRSGH